ncbi:hypothetical protein IB229_09660 [Pseudomonas sp. PDM14]|uniref:DUF7079 family protein n=1 Tax=Pseudomonas sp. PDM14 TaxID=2769288 RepID=UPI00177CB8E1|nr:hypothetical protein [Pseudomonas sp. PDM14]MBD9483238.1 hypothetical protein [Pseudomonas sp. PDM14]
MADPQAVREGVWLLLSELWLDTQLDAPAHARIAAGLRESGLSVDALQRIFLYEVAPLLWLNHWSVAGVWDAFDAQWLIAGCQRNRQRGALHRLRCRLLRKPMTYACIDDWQAILRLL